VKAAVQAVPTEALAERFVPTELALLRAQVLRDLAVVIQCRAPAG
jgi:hypothetical protein